MSGLVEKPKLPLSSTYQEDFTYRLDNLPPLPYCQEPCLYQSEQEKLDPRYFPISLPAFPCRKRESSFPIAAGFETHIHATLYKQQFGKDKRKDLRSELSSRNSSRVSVKSGLDDSSSVRESPQLEHPHAVPKVVLEELVKLQTYTPSSDLRDVQTSAAEAVARRKPITPDCSLLNKSLRYRQPVKNEKPEDWQKIGCIWDKAQERNGFNNSKSILDSTRQNYKMESSRLLSRPRFNPLPTPNQKSSPINGRSKRDFNKHIPGYGGYKPQLPIERSIGTDERAHRLQTTSKTYFRAYPKITYQLPRYGHPGPLSRLVTLTEPFNPFNKVVQQRIVVEGGQQTEG